MEIRPQTRSPLPRQLTIPIFPPPSQNKIHCADMSESICIFFLVAKERMNEFDLPLHFAFFFLGKNCRLVPIIIPHRFPSPPRVKSKSFNFFLPPDKPMCHFWALEELIRREECGDEERTHNAQYTQLNRKMDKVDAFLLRGFPHFFFERIWPSSPPANMFANLRLLGETSSTPAKTQEVKGKRRKGGWG